MHRTVPRRNLRTCSGFKPRQLPNGGGRAVVAAVVAAQLHRGVQAPTAATTRCSLATITSTSAAAVSASAVAPATRRAHQFATATATAAASSTANHDSGILRAGAEYQRQARAAASTILARGRAQTLPDVCARD